MEANVDIQILFLLIAQRRVGNRPERIGPRALKHRGKMYPKLMLQRAMAREVVRKNGRVKSLSKCHFFLLLGYI